MRKILLLIILLSLTLPAGALADVIEIRDPLGNATFEQIIDRLIDFIFKIAIVLVPLMIIIGAVMFVTSAGNVARVDQAKRIILWTVVGFAIVLLAKGILALIEQLLGI